MIENCHVCKTGSLHGVDYRFYDAICRSDQHVSKKKVKIYYRKCRTFE